MSYQIQYSPEKVRKYPMRTQKRTVRWNRLVIVTLLLAAGLWVKTNGLPDQLIPGDPTVTRMAASSFVEHLRNGDGVEEAFTVFCRQVLDGANQ